MFNNKSVEFTQNLLQGHKWRFKCGGLEASERKRIKEWKQQLSEYKTMVAELTYDNRVLKNLIDKKL